MIKKLNKERGPIKKQPWLYYFDKETDDLGGLVMMPMVWIWL